MTRQRVPESAAPEPSAPPDYSSTAWKRFWRSGSARAGAGIVLLTVVAALFASLLSPFDPMEIRRGREQLLAPGGWGELPGGGRATHWLGTDSQGRDIWARLLGGARISLAVGMIASLGSGLIGTLLGALAGFRGGWLDALAMRAADVVLAFPRLLLAIALLAVAPRPSLWLVVIVLAATGWAGVARLARAETLRAKELEYVLAARACGVGGFRLLFRHIMPGIWGLVAIWLALAIPGAIMAEAGLSFLGLGVEPGQPSWGGMISEASDCSLVENWWLFVFPGLALASSVLGWNLLGEALQESLNPRLAKR